MHEMGVASSILDAVRKEQDRHPGYVAAKVGVRIGRFAGVDRESLCFCFEAIVKESAFDGLELTVRDAEGDELDIDWIEFDDGKEAGT